MKKTSQFFWGIILLCLAFSCSDDSGTLIAPSETDQNFTVFTEIFEKFLESHPANPFTDGTSGLTFTGEEACSFAQQPSLYLNGQYYDLNTTTCYYSNDPEEGLEAFSIVNLKQQATGITVYAIATFLNMGIPQTGTYNIEYICNDYCYTTVSIRVYFVDQQGRTIQYYFGYPASIHVVNNNGKVTASFDGDFYPAFYPYAEVRGSGNVSCCD